MTRFLPWALTLGCAGLWLGQSLSQWAEQDRVRRAMAEVFDKPNDPVRVEPLVVAGEHALAGWLQDGRGGRTVLRKMQGQWTVVLCGGHGLKEATTLAQTGIPLETATEMARSLTAAEARLDPETLEKFALFDLISTLNVAPDAHFPAPPDVKK